MARAASGCLWVRRHFLCAQSQTLLELAGRGASVRCQGKEPVGRAGVVGRQTLPGDSSHLFHTISQGFKKKKKKSRSSEFKRCINLLMDHHGSLGLLTSGAVIRWEARGVLCVINYSAMGLNKSRQKTCFRSELEGWRESKVLLVLVMPPGSNRLFVAQRSSRGLAQGTGSHGLLEIARVEERPSPAQSWVC